jgi:hypothetical protein
MLPMVALVEGRLKSKDIFKKFQWQICSFFHVPQERVSNCDIKIESIYFLEITSFLA